MEQDLNKLSQTLNKKNFETFVCEKKEDAIRLVENMLEDDAVSSVGVGNSDTLRELGLYEVFKRHAQNVYIHKPLITVEIDRKALTCDMYFCSANAVAMDGHIVNIDGMGNRVGATCFGPKRLVYVIGKNKIVPTLEGALWRARNVAAPGIAKKYGRKTPCAKTGICTDCNATECVCAVTSIHRRKPSGMDISVILIGEELGI
jgi:L-lactate utilization protein LutB